MQICPSPSQYLTRHRAGDVLMIQPQNAESAVEEFLGLLGLDPDLLFCLHQNDPGSDLFPPLPSLPLASYLGPPPSHVTTPLPPDVPLPSSLTTPCSVRHLLTHYLDFQSVPRRSFFQLLCHFASGSELEQEKLEEFTTPEGQEELFTYCNRPRRTIMEVRVRICSRDVCSGTSEQGTSEERPQYNNNLSTKDTI